MATVQDTPPITIVATGYDAFAITVQSTITPSFGGTWFYGADDQPRVVAEIQSTIEAMAAGQVESFMVLGRRGLRWEMLQSGVR